jgi:hypothetical protein
MRQTGIRSGTPGYDHHSTTAMKEKKQKNLVLLDESLQESVGFKPVNRL